MIYLFKSRRGLGDALFCMPACLHLAKRGIDAFIECPEKFHDIFQLVSYTRAWRPNYGTPVKVFDTTLLDFHFSKVKIKDYVSAAFQELKDVPRGQNVTFDLYSNVEIPDYGLPKPYIVISPFGYSQYRNPSPEWFMAEVSRRFGHTRNVFCLTDKQRHGLPCPPLIAKSVAHLPKLLAEADEVFTVNSSPSIIAAAVRQKPYYHIHDWGYDTDDVDARCNYESPNQIVISDIPSIAGRLARMR